MKDVTKPFLNRILNVHYSTALMQKCKEERPFL